MVGIGEAAEATAFLESIHRVKCCAFSSPGRLKLLFSLQACYGFLDVVSAQVSGNIIIWTNPNQGFVSCPNHGVWKIQVIA